jgi:aminopeptidase N
MRLKLITVAVSLTLAGAALPLQAKVTKAARTAAPAAAVTTQLPRTVRPTHYDVSITPDPANVKFAGHVSIAIDVLQPTAVITLNAVDMVFAAVTLTTDAGVAQSAPRITLNEKEQTASFHFTRPLARGNYRLLLDYTGKVENQPAGLFYVDYSTAGGKKRALYTQFENSDARRMIPSWDEPAYKATFTLEAVVPASDMAVSNMPVERSTALADGRVQVRFARTPRMSTYLLFYASGDFDRLTTTEQGVELGVVTQKGVSGQAAFALESSRAVLREYNDYFGVAYPLPKLDNVAAPGQSQVFSAMENWGAIFSFENSILLDPAISTQLDKQRVFTVAAHEIAHQWFGDLVTMSWWDDLWLNEGFASWMEGRTSALLHPEWNSNLANVAGREKAMNRDALSTTHPVVQHVETVDQASQAFDDITYDKGQAVIAMLENYVGATAWRNGVRQYIKARAYGSSQSIDLWQAIEAAAGKPVKAIAHDFTLQPGVPTIRVESATCKNGSTTLHLVQGEFSKDQINKKPLRWRVPVIVQAVGSSAEIRTIVANGHAKLLVPGCAPLVINAGQSGYYRTLYEPQQFARLAKNFNALRTIDQLGILADSWSLGLAGSQSPAWFLDLARATPLDADPQVWGKVAEVFTFIDQSYADAPVRRAAFRKFAIARLTPVLADLGWSARAGELETIAILRSNLITTLGHMGDPVTVNEARRRYAASASDASAMPAALRKTLLDIVAYHADAATWDILHAGALTETSSLIRDQMFNLLASTADAQLARRALDLALTKEPGETISAAMIGRVARDHPDLAFDFAIAHMNQVNDKVEASTRSRYYPRLADRSADPAMIVKVKAYASANLPAGSRRDAETAMANIADRIKVRRERLPAIDLWLAKNGG